LIDIAEIPLMKRGKIYGTDYDKHIFRHIPRVVQKRLLRMVGKDRWLEIIERIERIKMIVIICIDDNFGMMFNHRRQSKDRILLEDMIDYSKEKNLYMNEYSYKLFSGFNPENLIVDNEFLDNAGTGEYCFVEDSSLLPYERQIETLIIYKWNRRYPADYYLDIPLEDRWKIKDTEDFKGSSHEKITKEIYTR
jgi:hypothetical protein